MDEEVPRHRRRRGGRKPYTIEWRLPSKPENSWLRPFDWTVWGRYETSGRRDQALSDMEQGRGAAGRISHIGYEFRRGPDPVRDVGDPVGTGHSDGMPSPGDGPV